VACGRLNKQNRRQGIEEGFTSPSERLNGEVGVHPCTVCQPEDTDGVCQ